MTKVAFSLFRVRAAALALILFAGQAAGSDMPEIDSAGSLQDAVMDDDIDRAAALIAAGANVNDLYWSGLASALHIAAGRNSRRMVELLIKAGADIEATGRKDPMKGVTPLHIAAAINSLNSAEALIEAGARLDPANDPEGATPLYMASFYQPGEFLDGLWFPREASLAWSDQEIGAVAQLLIRRGANINVRTQTGETPLHYAVLKSAPQVVALLLERGADPSARHNAHWTPLHYALVHSGPDFRSSALALIERGAAVDAQTIAAGWRPLHLAARRDATDVVRALLARGADVNARTRLGGSTPLHLAVQSGASDEMRTILQAAGGVDRKDPADMFPRLYLDGDTEPVRNLESMGGLRADYMYPEMEITGDLGSSYQTGYPRSDIEGSFTAADARERLVMERIGNSDMGIYAFLVALIDKDGITRLQWIAHGSGFVAPTGVCRDALTGLDHVVASTNSAATGIWPSTVYMHYDPDSGKLIEGFDDAWFWEQAAAPDANGECRWRAARDAVAAYERAFTMLRVDENYEFLWNDDDVLQTRAIPAETALSSLAVLQMLPGNIAAVSAGPETERWETIVLRKARPRPRYDTGAVLVRDKQLGGWRSVSDCYYTTLEKIEGNVLHFSVPAGCRSRTTSQLAIEIDLVTLESRMRDYDL